MILSHNTEMKKMKTTKAHQKTYSRRFRSFAEGVGSTFNIAGIPLSVPQYRKRKSIASYRLECRMIIEDALWDGINTVRKKNNR